MSFLAPSRTIVPRGKGLYLRNLLQHPPPGELAIILRRIGVRWVAPTAILGDKGPEPVFREGLYKAYGRALRAAEIELWAHWWLPTTDRISEHQRGLMQAADWMGARGLLCNPERDFLERPEAMRELAGGLASAANRRRMGLVFASYGAPWNFPHFPWQEMAQVGATGSPLVFHRLRDQAQRAIRAWKRKGFVYVAPSLAAWNLSYEEAKRRLAKIPEVPAAIFWPGGPGLPSEGILQAIKEWRGADPKPWWSMLRLFAGPTYERVSAQVGV